MDTFRLFFSLSLFFLNGIFVLLALGFPRERLTWPEYGALIYGFGAGITTLIMFALSSLDCKFHPLTVWIVSLLFGATVFVLRKGGLPGFWRRSKRGGPQLVRGKASRAGSILAALLLLYVAWEFAYYLVYSTIKPIWAWDTWMIWSFKARVFFSDGQVLPEFLANPAYIESHLEYPLLVPLAETWIFLSLGRLADGYEAILFPLFNIFLSLVFYYRLRRFLPRTLGLIFLAIFASIPLLWADKLVGYGEIPLIFYFSLACLFLNDWMKSRRRGDLLIAGFAAGLAAWTKMEGLLLLASLGGILLVDSRADRGRRRDVAFFFILALGLSLPWLIYQKICFVPNPRSYVFSSGHLLNSLNEIPNVAVSFLRYLVNPACLYILPGAFLFAILNLKNRAGFHHLHTMLVLPLGCYFLMYIPLPEDLGASIDRLFLHFIFLGAYLLALHFRDLSRRFGLLAGPASGSE